MKKIPTLFKRDLSKKPSLVYDEVNPGCEWVIEGLGVPTGKFDGTCCKFENGILFKRREVKSGKEIPDNFEVVDFDKNTGKTIGWVPVDLYSKENKYYKEALDICGIQEDGTYELCGPKINGNPEKCTKHRFFKHGEYPRLGMFGSKYQDIYRYFRLNPYNEGIVWHHPDGRMAKIKLKDFGIKRKT